MGAPARLRVVLDTNVLVSALVFRTGRLVWLRDAGKSGSVVPILDRSCLDELIRVLAYPEFGLSPEELHGLLQDLLPFAEVVELLSFPDVSPPECRDPDDQKFLDLAAATSVDVPGTGGRDLLDVADDAPVEIEKPQQFRKRLEAGGPA